MKKFLAIALLMFTAACTPEQAEELAFRKVMEYQLKEECGEGNRDCLAAVESQIKSCMEQSDWRRYLENEEDQEELLRFIRVFFPCFKDASGNSYFSFPRDKA